MGIQDHNVYIELEELEFHDDGSGRDSEKSTSVSLDLQYHWNILYRFYFQFLLQTTLKG